MRGIVFCLFISVTVLQGEGWRKPQKTEQDLGSPCHPHTDICTSPGSHCSEGVCECKPNYETDWTVGRCLLKTIRIGDSCEIDNMCKTIITHSLCSKEKRCGCEPTFVSSRNGARCLLADVAYGSSCFESVQCRGYPRMSECSSKGYCECAKGHIYSYEMRKCIPIRGQVVGGPVMDNSHAECTSSNQCWNGPLGHFSACQNGKCSCTSDTILVPGHSKCLSTAWRVGDACEMDRQCTENLGPRSECSPDGLCVCGGNSVPNSNRLKCVDQTMLSMIGRPCQNTDQCVGPPGASECTLSGICACKQGYITSTTRGTCLPVQNKLGGGCLEIQQCQQGTPGEFSECLGSIEKKGICNCTTEAVNEPGQNKCHKKADRVGAPCQTQVQCTVTLGTSHCLAGTCRCLGGRRDTPPGKLHCGH